MEKKEKIQAPSWNLGLLFNGPQDPKIQQFKETIEEIVYSINSYKGKFESMLIPKFEILVSNYTNLTNICQTLAVYSNLYASEDRTDSKRIEFETATNEFINSQLEKISWLHEEFFNLPEAMKITILADPRFKDECIWLGEMMIRQPLNEMLLFYLNRISNLSSRWARSYKRNIKKLSFLMKGKKLSLSEIRKIAYCDESKEKRDLALRIMGNTLSERADQFADILDNIYNHEIATSQLLEKATGEMDDTVTYDAMQNGVKEIIDTVHKDVQNSMGVARYYYKFLAAIQGRKEIDYNDRQNPIKVTPKRYSWEEAKEIIFSVAYKFDANVGEIVNEIFNSGIINAENDPKKDEGAYCIAYELPYITTRFDGTIDSINTLMHEIFHAVHHRLLFEKVSHLNNYTSLALSETFSQFGEKLLTQYLLEKAETAEERLHIMIDNVDAQISSIHRQIAFANFEEEAFREKKMGAFNEQSLTRIFQNKMKDYLGFEPNGGAEKEWIVIHHIFNSPWYCRYYAISQLIVNRLWEKYQNDKEGTFTFFFYRMAVNGAYLDLENVLSSFALNIKDRDFFYKGINILKEDVLRMVNQAKELGYNVPEIDF